MRISDPHNCKFNYLDPHNRKFDYPDPQNGKFDYPDPHNCKFDYSDHHNCKINYPDQRRCGIGFGLICNIAKSMIRSFVVKSLDPIQFHFFSWIFMYQVLSKIFVCELWTNRRQNGSGTMDIRRNMAIGIWIKMSRIRQTCFNDKLAKMLPLNLVITYVPIVI